jgi:hypothetical protein
MEASEEVDAFLADIIAVCNKHKLMLTHEDSQGAFIVDRMDKRSLMAISDAHMYYKVKKGGKQ